MTDRKQFERLNENPRKPASVPYHGKLTDPYWNDPGLRAKYSDCPQFLDRIQQKYEHEVGTLPTWPEFDTAKRKSEEAIANFGKWLEEELQNPELKKCYDDATRGKIKEIKEQLKGRH